MKRVVLAILVVLGPWFLVDPLRHYYFPKNAKPRAVTARGDLAADEQNTTDIFKNNASSVVYVTSIALRRGFFSMNAVDIPQGTGSGFIWDNQRRIVTNYHMISDASRVQVTTAMKRQFPDVAVIQGNAVKLCQLCNRYERHIGTVVSSLQLLSLASSSVAALGMEIHNMLGPKGSLIQYTYLLNNRPSPLAAYLHRISVQTVWCNMPPAEI